MVCSPVQCQVIRRGDFLLAIQRRILLILLHHEQELMYNRYADFFVVHCSRQDID